MNHNGPMPQDASLPEDELELIAFHLGEPCDGKRIRTRLETDTAFAELSESVAHTLRVFSAEPVPSPDVDGVWQRLRGTLPVLETAQRRSRWRWFSLVPAAVLALVFLAIGFTLWHRHANSSQVDEAGVIHLRPPVSNASMQGVDQHLDRAERWLTVVNHATTPLDDTTLAEGRQLLTSNAVYLQDARSHGNLPDVAVLDRLGRVLTSANHPAESGVRLRVEMNTDGLLFDLRILRQNQN